MSQNDFNYFQKITYKNNMFIFKRYKYKIIQTKREKKKKQCLFQNEVKTRSNHALSPTFERCFVAFTSFYIILWLFDLIFNNILSKKNNLSNFKTLYKKKKKHKKWKKIHVNGKMT